MFTQPLAPIAGSLPLSALLASLPLVLLFLLLGVFKVKAWVAALSGLAASILIAMIGWGMPALMTLSATAEGAFYGAIPIMWILLNAVWVYQLSVITGWFESLGQLIRSISDDQRVLAILIAFCFGALMESLAGFGAPVAISAAMLMAAGMKPMKAAIVSCWPTPPPSRSAPWAPRSSPWRASPASTCTCSPRWPVARRRSWRSSSRSFSYSSSTASAA